VVFTDRILIRPELDPVDLLEGGAIGIASGRVRHQIDGTTDMLRFSHVTTVNLRAFADMRRLLPESPWAKGLRLSLDVINLTNHRQSVRDRFGNTPLQYQPGYRDPIGRTVEFELRKVF
jgi:outer membrane receptor protein involved in Fe transport